MKAIKILFSIICLLILVVVFAAFALIYFIDPDKMKPVIIEEVKNATGYILTIDGKLSWSFYPRLAILADHLQLQSPGQSRAFMEASNVHMATDLHQLWQSQEKLQGKITLSSLALMNMKFQNVSANVAVVNEILTLNAINASLYGGKLDGSISGRQFAATPEWQWDMRLTDVQIKPLLQDANGTDSKIKIAGTGTFSMQGGTRGKTRDELLNQLNATTVYSLQDGIVEGMDINYFLQLADATLNKRPTDQLINSNQTAFNGLVGTALIKNGVADTRDTQLLAPTFMTHAEGNLDLISRKLNFALQVKPQLANTKIKWDIPVLLTGDMAHPDVRLDVVGIQKILADIEIENLKKKAVTQIQKHVPGKAGEFLQKLLGKQP